MAYPRIPLLHGASGEYIDGGFPFHVNANTTGQLLVTGPCILECVVVGKAGSADWAVTIYDGIDNTGTVISVSDFNAGGTYQFNAAMEKGVYIAASGATAGDLTFIIADPSKI